MRLKYKIMEEKDVTYNHVLKYTGIFGGVQGLNIGLGLVRTKLVALLLGPSGMGLASLFNTTVNMIFQATNLGLPFSAVRRISELHQKGDQSALAHYVKVVRGWTLLTALIGILVCVVIGPFLSHTTFAWGDHTLHFVLLAPAVGMLTITGGETAILKGVHRVGALAVIQVVSILAALVISVPVYFFFGASGIVPVIVLMALATMLVTVRCSWRAVPLQLTGVRHIMGEGTGMIRLGVAYTLAIVIGSLTELVIRSYLNVTGDLDILGLYNAGYMLTITYAGMVFSAMETDYFPRLSAVQGDDGAVNETVNRQTEVSLLLLSPMLVTFMVTLPILIPLLFSRAFLPVVGMAQVAALAMYLKVLTMPVAYITLARGQALAYLILESLYCVALILLIIFCYQRWGLYGTGVAVTLAYLFDFLIVMGYAYKKNGYRCSATVFRYALVQVLLGLLSYITVCVLSGIAYWLVGGILILLSTCYSLRILRRKTHLWQALMRRFRSSTTQPVSD